MHGQAYCIIILNCEVETFDFTAEKIIICAFSSIFLFSWNQKHREFIIATKKIMLKKMKNLLPKYPLMVVNSQISNPLAY